MEYKTKIGITYLVRATAAIKITCAVGASTVTILDAQAGDHYVTSSTTSVDVESSGSWTLTEVFNRAPVTSDGGGGTPSPADITRRVVDLPDGTLSRDFSAEDNRTVFRLTLSDGQVFAAGLAAPQSGKSYELVFEVTPLADSVNFDFQNWQWVDQAPKPTAWVVGKTYCFTVVYMDGVTAPFVALSYTRNAQS